MKKIIDYVIKSKLVINLIVFVILAVGLTIVADMNREAFPDVSLDMVTVLTIYPGAAPDEVENLISIPIEKELREVSGISKVEGFNIENVSVMVVYLDDSLTDKKKAKAVTDVKDAVEGISDLPEDALDPEVEEITTEKMQVFDIALTTTRKDEAGYAELRATAKRLEEEILFIDGVAEINKLGYRDREYLVEVMPESLQQYRIGLNAVIGRLMARNIDLPGGALRVEGKEYLLRTIGQFKDIEEVENLVVFSNDAGFVTKLSDIARISDTFEEKEIHERVDLNDAIVLEISKKKAADTIRITDKLKEHLAEFDSTLSKGISSSYFNDSSVFVRSRLSSLVTNASVGFVFLALILLFILGKRLSLVVGLSIPISFMMAFILMQQQGITLNVISMFALVMVLGMIVDFSIVISENSYRHMGIEKDKRKAIRKGVLEVAAPMTVTLICIVAAFAPLLFVGGLVGKFIYAIPMVIILCLVASWFCALFILPNYLDSLVKAPKVKKNKEEKSQPGSYEKILRKMVQRRYIVVVIIIALLFGSLKALSAVDFVFMPSTYKGIYIKLTMPQGTNLEETNKVTIPFEELVRLLPKTEVESIRTRVGVHMSSGLDMRPKDGTHKSVVYLNLTPAGDRDRSAEEIVAQLRKNIVKLQDKDLINKDVQFLFELSADGMPKGKPISIEIRGNDLDKAAVIANEYSAFLHTIDGVSDIVMDLEQGKTEFRYKINEVNAMRAGLTVADVAQSILFSYKGAVATKVKKGDEEIDVRVRFPDWARRSVDSLDDVMIENKYGGLVSLEKVTSYEKKRGYAAINRKDYKRVVKVDANIDLNKVTAMKVNKMLVEKFESIERENPGVFVNYAGEQEETGDSMSDLGRLFIVALAVIFLVLVAFFNSIWLPIVIMVCIPFSLIGVAFALLSHGQPMSFMSVLGLFSLAGVIVSNTLVLVHFINNLRKEEGLNVTEAVVHGGALRFRPVILTSGTTVLGLIPTIYGLGGKDAFVAPLGLAFGYGLIFATVITLILVPCFYHVAEDIKGVTARLLGKVGFKMKETLI